MLSWAGRGSRGGSAAHGSGAVRADDIAEALQAVSPKVAKLLREHGDVDRWVERTQPLCQHLRTPTPDVSLGEVQRPQNVEARVVELLSRKAQAVEEELISEGEAVVMDAPIKASRFSQ